MKNSITRRLGDPVVLLVICGAVGYGLPLYDGHPYTEPLGFLIAGGLIGLLSLGRLFSNIFRESPRRPFRALVALAMLPAFVCGYKAGSDLRHHRFVARCQAAVQALEPLLRKVETSHARSLTAPGVPPLPAGYEDITESNDHGSLRIDYRIGYGHLAYTVGQDVFPPTPDGWTWTRLEFESKWLFPRRGGPPWRVPSDDAVARGLASPGAIPPETSATAGPPSLEPITR